MRSITDRVTAMRELAGEDLGGLSDAVLLDRMRHLQEMRCLVDAAAVATAGAVHRRGAASHDGSASTKSWIQGRLRLAPGEAGTLVDTAAAMPELPQFADALTAGRITLGHAAVAAWLARKVGRAAPELVPQAEELLFPHTQRLNSSELRHVAKRIASYLVPERDDPPDPERALFLAQTYGGIWDLKGCLSPEFGAMLQTILTTLPKPDAEDERSAAERRHDALAELVRRILDSRELPANGGEQPHLAVLVHASDLRTTATGRCVLAEDPAPDGEGDDRNGGWNDHRASADDWDADPSWSADADWGAASGADANMDREADPGWDAEVAPGSAEIWDWETLADWLFDPQAELAVAALGAAASDADRPATAMSGGRSSGSVSGTGASGARTGRGPGDAAAPGSGPSGLGHVPGTRWVPQPGEGGRTDFGDHLPLAAIQRLSCDAAINRIVLGPDDVPLSAGRRTRLVPPTMRRALVVRDQGCRFHYCTRPPQWTQAHHVVPWSEGGPTDLSNLLLVCDFHHHRVHDHGWTLAFDGRTVTIRRPDGTTLDPPP